jgi:hypothetical protein
MAPISHPSVRLTDEPWLNRKYLAESLLTLALTPRSYPPSISGLSYYFTLAR